MRLGKDAMYRQLDQSFEDALDYLRAQLIVNLSASPFYVGKAEDREEMLRRADEARRERRGCWSDARRAGWNGRESSGQEQQLHRPQSSQDRRTYRA